MLIIKRITDISKWDLSNTNEISGLFSGCSSLKEIPDISKWNLTKVSSISSLFYKCSSLKKLPDISIWNLFNSNINNYQSDLYLESEDINEEIYK